MFIFFVILFVTEKINKQLLTPDFSISLKNQNIKQHFIFKEKF